MDPTSSFLPSAIASHPREAVEWFGRAAVEEAARALVARELHRTADSAWAASFRAAVPRAGAEDSSYLSARLRVGAAEVLLAPRFLGGAPHSPFVDLIGWIGAPPGWSDLLAAVRDRWPAFGPEAVRVLLPGRAAPDAGSVPHTRDQYWLAGRTGDLAGRPIVPGPDVELHRLSAADSLSRIREGYAAFRARRPDLAHRVHPSGIADLRRAADDDGLFAWSISGVPAGVIAVERGRRLGLRGFLVQEEVALPGAVGKRSAARAQQLVARELAGRDPNAALFGTIDAGNRASLRCAEAVGRSVVATWWFVGKPPTQPTGLSPVAT